MEPAFAEASAGIRHSSPLVSDGGWRTRTGPIRTFSEIDAHIELRPVRKPALYQKLAPKAQQLRFLGLSYLEIAERLGVHEITATRACKYEA